MAATTGMMGAAMLAQTASNISGSVSSAAALKTNAQYQKTIADANARFADIASNDALARGETNARLLRQNARSMIGAERTAAAAGGVEVNSGSAADIQANTNAVSALDAQMIRNNAMREALGYKVQSINYTAQGKFTDLTGAAGAESTLLTGGIKAIGTGLESAYWFSK